MKGKEVKIDDNNVLINGVELRYDKWKDEFFAEKRLRVLSPHREARESKNIRILA